MRTRSLLNLITLFAAILGVADSLYLTIEHFKPELADVCGATGCGSVLNGDWSKIGPIPTATFGLAMYLLFAALCVLRARGLGALRNADSRAASAYAGSAAMSADASGADTASLDADGPGAAAAAATHVAPPVQAAPAATDEALAIRKRLRRLDLGIWLLASAGFVLSWLLQYVALFQIGAFCPFCFTSAALVSLIFLMTTRDYAADAIEFTGEVKMLCAISAFVILMLAFTVAPRVIEQLKADLHPRPAPTMNWLFSPGMPQEGSLDARYTIVEFADYQCPACQKAAIEIGKFLQGKLDRYRFIFRNFPIPRHPWGQMAARAALAADAQGKFWPMHDYLYAHQKEMAARSFNARSFDGFAAAIGLDVARFRRDIESTANLEAVQHDQLDARRIGVRNTPTFFLVSPTGITTIEGITQLKTELSQLERAR
jgi:protein-disulfide isomerase